MRVTKRAKAHGKSAAVLNNPSLTRHGDAQHTAQERTKAQPSQRTAREKEDVSPFVYKKPLARAVKLCERWSI